MISSASTMVAKIGPGWNSKRLLRRVVDRHAGDVARQQVGRELDAAVRALHRGRERAGELRLAGAREVLEEHVALGEQAGEREPRHVLLAEDGLLDVADELVEGVGEPRDLLLGDVAGGTAHGCRSPVGAAGRCVRMPLGWLPPRRAVSGWVRGRSVSRPRVLGVALLPAVGAVAGHGHRSVGEPVELVRLVEAVRRLVGAAGAVVGVGPPRDGAADGSDEVAQGVGDPLAVLARAALRRCAGRRALARRAAR